ncbi:hypothetical protein KM043_014687 [Ampulex compressa]|nr:hypothetical protein KM043_014687 [Ampulex compressa]
MGRGSRSLSSTHRPLAESAWVLQDNTGSRANLSGPRRHHRTLDGPTEARKHFTVGQRSVQVDASSRSTAGHTAVPINTLCDYDGSSWGASSACRSGAHATTRFLAWSSALFGADWPSTSAPRMNSSTGEWTRGQGMGRPGARGCSPWGGKGTGERGGREGKKKGGGAGRGEGGAGREDKKDRAAVGDGAARGRLKGWRAAGRAGGSEFGGSRFPRDVGRKVPAGPVLSPRQDDQPAVSNIKPTCTGSLSSTRYPNLPSAPLGPLRPPSDPLGPPRPTSAHLGPPRAPRPPPTHGRLATLATIKTYA